MPSRGIKEVCSLETGIRFYKSRISAPASRRGYAAEVLLLFCYICGVEGILYALDFVLFLNFRLEEAMAVTALICLLLWLLAVPKGKWKILSWPLAGAGGIWLYHYMEDLPEEIAVFYRGVRTDIWDLTEKDVTKAVILFAAVCGVFLFLLTYGARLTFVFLIISIPMIFLGPLLGQKLDIIEICLFGIFHIGTWILGAGYRKKSKFSGGEFVGALLTLSLFLLLMAVTERAGDTGVDMLLEASSRVQEQIHQISVRITGREEEGAVNRGNQTPTGQDRLQVVVSEIPQEVLYLKDFIGERYMGEYWEAADESVFLSQQGIQIPENVSPFVRYADEETARISVQVRDLLHGEEELLPSEFSPGLQMEGGEAYSEFAGENYMEVPVSNLPQLLQLCEDHPVTDFGGITDHILQLIQDRMAYSRTPGQVPYGRDTLEYYLFERGQGYCQHFASAAVLMYRIYGVPARYAAGYIVRPSEFQETEGGFQAVVTDENAHAWAEVYLPGQGWEVVEATPPGSVVEAVPNSSENSQENLQNGENPTDTETTPTPTEEPETEQQDKEGAARKQSHAPGLREAVSLAVLILIFLFLGWLTVKVLAVRRIRMRKKYARWGADRLYGQMVEVLHFGGFLTEYDGQEKEFAELLSRQVETISEEEAQKGLKAALTAAYGKEGSSREQRRQVYKIYQKTCQYMLENIKGFRKIYFQYGRAYW
ncbi:MAG: transglutaminase-like domain-containing protein [Ruminococcus sp.]|jgi:hypothetical protein